MMVAAERHGEFVADLATEGSGLREFQMMGIARRALTDQAGLRGDECEVGAVVRRRLGLCSGVTFSWSCGLWSSGAAVIGVASPSDPCAGLIGSAGPCSST